MRHRRHAMISVFCQRPSNLQLPRALGQRCCRARTCLWNCSPRDNLGTRSSRIASRIHDNHTLSCNSFTGLFPRSIWPPLLVTNTGRDDVCAILVCLKVSLDQNIGRNDSNEIPDYLIDALRVMLVLLRILNCYVLEQFNT